MQTSKNDYSMEHSIRDVAYRVIQNYTVLTKLPEQLKGVMSAVDFEMLHPFPAVMDLAFISVINLLFWHIFMRKYSIFSIISGLHTV